MSSGYYFIFVIYRWNLSIFFYPGTYLSLRVFILSLIYSREHGMVFICLLPLILFMVWDITSQKKRLAETQLLNWTTKPRFWIKDWLPSFKYFVLWFCVIVISSPFVQKTSPLFHYPNNFLCLFIKNLLFAYMPSSIPSIKK